MALYGLNFNGSQIPARVKIKFAARRKFDGKWHYLQGVATTPLDKEAAEIAAAKPGRTIVVKEVPAQFGTYYGIYVA